ncbi:hypothetical protein N7475_000337 [Penicillium sp. IBT 31633x]|nr:hypothetical protein N7475_000337 [Penicillium sp. IBT 31633x]
MVTPNFPFIAVYRNIANISRLYDTFERSTYRIEDLLHKMHLRRHVEEVHHLSTERNYYTKEEMGSDIDTD